MSQIRNIQKGTIFIVDISGFTRFVKETESEKGVIIIAHLLKKIVASNSLGFRVSEIEGDAILFYKYGKPYAVNVLLEQFEQMLSAFKHKVNELKLYSSSVDHLSIKAVAHYGDISRYRIYNFDKLYGQVLIESHRLLKNHIHQNTYALITDEYVDACETDVLLTIGYQQCEKYDVGKLCYTYFPYAEHRIRENRLALVC